MELVGFGACHCKKCKRERSPAKLNAVPPELVSNSAKCENSSRCAAPDTSRLHDHHVTRIRTSAFSASAAVPRVRKQNRMHVKRIALLSVRNGHEELHIVAEGKASYGRVGLAACKKQVENSRGNKTSAKRNPKFPHEPHPLRGPSKITDVNISGSSRPATSALLARLHFFFICGRSASAAFASA